MPIFTSICLETVLHWGSRNPISKPPEVATFLEGPCTIRESSSPEPDKLLDCCGLGLYNTLKSPVIYQWVWLLCSRSY